MRKIRMGMVGGGIGAFIGAVHRYAACLDNKIDLVCGAFSSNPEKSKQSGHELSISLDRTYANYTEMFEKESKLPKDQRMELVSIVTPNHVHFEPCKLALENGFHVICDKPLTYDTNEAKKLVQLVNQTGLKFAVTHAYTGYPMVKQAKSIIANGELGKIRKVIVEYPQGWLSTKLENTNSKQAGWRTDPSKSGKAGAMGDIGTHAENLAEYITGLRIKELAADLSAVVEGRALDDDGNVLLRFDNGAKGVLIASQIAAGEENALRIRVYGEKGGIDWAQQEPNTLWVKWLNQPTQMLRTGVGILSESAQVHTRIPAGHPEGYLEAFANIYRNIALELLALEQDKNHDTTLFDYPDITDGVRGMQFIDAVVDSSQKNAAWTKLPN